MQHNDRHPCAMSHNTSRTARLPVTNCELKAQNKHTCNIVTNKKTPKRSFCCKRSQKLTDVLNSFTDKFLTKYCMCSHKNCYLILNITLWNMNSQNYHSYHHSQSVLCKTHYNLTTHMLQENSNSNDNISLFCMLWFSLTKWQVQVSKMY